jgi:hypothetical protein
VQSPILLIQCRPLPLSPSPVPCMPVELIIFKEALARLSYKYKRGTDICFPQPRTRTHTHTRARAHTLSLRLSRAVEPVKARAAISRITIFIARRGKAYVMSSEIARPWQCEGPWTPGALPHSTTRRLPPNPPPPPPSSAKQAPVPGRRKEPQPLTCLSSTAGFVCAGAAFGPLHNRGPERGRSHGEEDGGGGCQRPGDARMRPAVNQGELEPGERRRLERGAGPRPGRPGPRAAEEGEPGPSAPPPRAARARGPGAGDRASTAPRHSPPVDVCRRCSDDGLEAGGTSAPWTPRAPHPCTADTASTCVYSRVLERAFRLYACVRGMIPRRCSPPRLRSTVLTIFLSTYSFLFLRSR